MTVLIALMNFDGCRKGAYELEHRLMTSMLTNKKINWNKKQGKEIKNINKKLRINNTFFILMIQVIYEQKTNKNIF